jgi:hypothetical protein
MGTHQQSLTTLLQDVRACALCAPQLPLGPRPVLQCHESARILIAGQAPGRKVHESGAPFQDPSGDRLRAWLGIPPETFYDPHKIALLPMGFCYPGTGPSGDLPPRPECAPAWRQPLLEHLKKHPPHSGDRTVRPGTSPARRGFIGDGYGPVLAQARARRGATAAPQPQKQPLARQKPMVRRRTASGAQGPR